MYLVVTVSTAGEFTVHVSVLKSECLLDRSATECVEVGVFTGQVGNWV